VVDGGQVLEVWGTKPVELTDSNAGMTTMSRERADTRTDYNRAAAAAFAAGRW
jgi:hypothetical protein